MGFITPLLAFDWPSVLASPETLIFMIPIVAILVGGLTTITKQLIRHRERMAMIEQGMNPDRPADSIEK
jgi:hypothetical protein